MGLKEIDNDIDKKRIYPTLKQIKEWGYRNFQFILPNNAPRLYPNQQWDSIMMSNCKNEKIPPKSKNTIRILSYNVHNWVKRCYPEINPAKDSINGSARVLDDFFTFFKDSNADILCLQEVSPIIDESELITDGFKISSINFSDLKKYLKDYDHNFIMNTTTGNGILKIQYQEYYYYLGNAIFSKIKPISMKAYRFINERGFVVFEFDNFYLINLHFEYYNAPLQFYSNFEPVMHQYDELYNFVKKLKKDVIITGDFNLPYKPFKHPFFEKQKKWKYDENIPKYFKNLLKDFKDIHSSPKLEKRITNFQRSMATDFFFINKKSKIKVKKAGIIKKDLSDHYPLFIDISMG